MKSTIGLPADAEMVASSTSSDDDSSSESDCQSDTGLRENAKDSYTDSEGSKGRSVAGGKVGGGRHRRWTGLEESRLRPYMIEHKSWSWIASTMRRSESAVKQHWEIMEKLRRKA
jgi:hypothetical protein